MWKWVKLNKCFFLIPHLTLSLPAATTNQVSQNPLTFIAKNKNLIRPRHMDRNEAGKRHSSSRTFSSRTPQLRGQWGSICFLHVGVASCNLAVIGLEHDWHGTQTLTGSAQHYTPSDTITMGWPQHSRKIIHSAIPNAGAMKRPSTVPQITDRHYSNREAALTTDAI